MTTLIQRSITGREEFQRIADFLNACEWAGDRESVTTVEELEHDADSPRFDLYRDQRIWEAANGEIVGLAQLWIPRATEDDVIDGHLSLNVHLAHRGSLEVDMLTWAEHRLHEVSLERRLRPKLYAHCRDTDVERIMLLERQGFTQERRFLTESRSLHEPIPAVQLPDGFTFLDGRDAIAPQDWVDLYNQTFVDHWNFHPVTVEQKLHWLTNPDYRPELEVVVVAADGKLAGFCTGHIEVGTNAFFDRREGWIAVLGTRRGYRRLGLGRSLLLDGLHRLKSAGMDTALLGVDTENPNCAYDLYHSAGFSPKFSRLSFGKLL